MSEIQRHIGDRKIDIVTAHPEETDGLLPQVVVNARKDGIAL
jgi:hypothetical protein